MESKHDELGRESGEGEEVKNGRESAVGEEEESAVGRTEWPAGVLEYVDRCFDLWPSSTSGRQKWKEEMEEFLRIVFLKTSANGSLWTIDWYAVEPPKFLQQRAEQAQRQQADTDQELVESESEGLRQAKAELREAACQLQADADLRAERANRELLHRARRREAAALCLQAVWRGRQARRRVLAAVLRLQAVGQSWLARQAGWPSWLAGRAGWRTEAAQLPQERGGRVEKRAESVRSGRESSAEEHDEGGGESDGEKEEGDLSSRESGREEGDQSSRESGRKEGDESGREPGREEGDLSSRESGREEGDESGREPGREEGDESGREPGREEGDEGGRKRKSRSPGRIAECR
jgi:hypothetical protein